MLFRSPIATDGRSELVETAAQAESISLAFLVLLERLSPVERAVFLLRDVFEYEYEEIASIVGKAEANCRQILHRARQRLADRPRYEVSYEARERLAEQFVRAAAGGDVDGLLALLAEDVVFTGDGGGVVRTVHRPVRGAANVVRGSLGSLRWLPADATARIEPINGGPAIVVYAGGRPIQVVAVEVAGGRIARIDAVVNPAKLGRVGSGGGPPPELPVGPAT